MKGRFGNRQRLEHALDAIAEIENYINDQPFPEFLNNSMMRFACIKQLEIIGEACNHLDETIRGEFPEVQCRQVTGLRHVLVH
ncbi:MULTISPECIES: HepT-like ribonuclease domain-containing protein [unclassified Spirosoma]|uniref:HepT-like ribonuclease domain-containing protein n=1 Tax=unclassified Spirosoma TaxID=2621999 RepID=UPI001AD59CAA|nr:MULTISPECIES: HepT-like ribonuclease domain-containing protein [unclassified Spirosoma]MBN8822906.1 DUF86 domain-containing protein [Spirosoma sp.]